jgi:hypothetical protein
VAPNFSNSLVFSPPKRQPHRYPRIKGFRPTDGRTPTERKQVSLATGTIASPRSGRSCFLKPSLIRIASSSYRDRLAPGLRTAGIDVQYWKSGNRIIRLQRTGRTRTPIEMNDDGSSLQE